MGREERREDRRGGEAMGRKEGRSGQKWENRDRKGKRGGTKERKHLGDWGVGGGKEGVGPGS